MAGIFEFLAGTLFKFRVWGQWISNPSEQAVNEWEAIALADGNINHLNLLAARLALFHRRITHQGWRTFKVEIATWVPDSQPYDPFAFAIQEWNFPGVRSLIGDYLPMETTGQINKSLLVGRQGKLFQRGALGELDVTASSGEPIFANGNWASDVEDGIEESNLAEHFRNGPNFIQLACVTGDGSNTRRVGALVTRGVVSVNHNHKYFDVAAANGQFGPTIDLYVEPAPPLPVFDPLDDLEVNALARTYVVNKYLAAIAGYTFRGAPAWVWPSLPEDYRYLPLPRGQHPPQP